MINNFHQIKKVHYWESSVTTFNCPKCKEPTTFDGIIEDGAILKCEVCGLESIAKKGAE